MVLISGAFFSRFYESLFVTTDRLLILDFLSPVSLFDQNHKPLSSGDESGFH